MAVRHFQSTGADWNRKQLKGSSAANFDVRPAVARPTPPLHVNNYETTEPFIRNASMHAEY